MCLVDRLRASVPGITPEQLVKLDKLAQTAVFTSQGIPFILAGEEMMRNKKGVHNSFESPDSINAIDWRLKAIHSDVFAYYKGLIALRKAHPAFRMGSAELVRKHLEFLPVEGTNLIAFRLKGHANGDAFEDIIVILNANVQLAKVAVPEGKYTVLCKDGMINLAGGLGATYGPEMYVAAQSALIIGK
jgi:pullulanase